MAEVKAQLAEGELLFAFLDDVYVVAQPTRVRFIYNLLGARFNAEAGIELHEGKTRTWNRRGVCPEAMQELGPDVWSPCGIKILGTPVGSQEYVERLEERLDDEEKLWNAISWVPDLQCAWQILVQCAGPRCHHFVRTMPPSQSDVYARGHDDGMMSTMHTLLGRLTGTPEQKTRANMIALLPSRLGGHGLRSALRLSSGAFWASWADALQMVADRLSTVADQILRSLETDAPTGCLGELQEAARTLDSHSFVDRPTWEQLKFGARPPPFDAESGEWQHGWQHHASSASEHHFRETVIVAMSCAADQAHLRSHSGPGFFARMPHRIRIRTSARVVSDVGAGEVALATPHFGRGGAEHSGTTPSRVPTPRSVEEQGEGPRAYSGSRVSRGRGFRQVQRKASRHERASLCER